MKKPRTFYAYGRFVQYLLREFRWSLGTFAALVLVGGLLVTLAYHRRPLDYAEACYAVFMMIFMQPALEFPAERLLQPLWFVIPIVGLGAIADSVVRMGYLLFSRKQNLQEWQIMNASMMRNHIVVVGAGKVGYSILRDLLALKEQVVAIERKADSPLVTELLDLGVPIIRGEGRLKKTLEQAGVAHAKAVILVTDDDLANLDSALTAREINPNVRVVLRLFDETLATKVAGMFKMPAISTSATCAPSFIAAATGRSVLAGFSLDGERRLHVADVRVRPESPVAGRNVGEVQERYGVNIVMHKRDGTVNVNPEHGLTLAAEDRMLVIAPIEKIADLENP